MFPPFLKKALKWIVLPALFLAVSFMYNTAIAMVALLIYIAIMVYIKRVTILMSLGTARYAKKDLEGALRWYSKAYATGKAKPKSVISYAYVLLKAGNPEKASALLDKLLDKELEASERNLAKTIQSLVVWKIGDIDRSIQILEKIIPEYKTTIIYGNYGFLLLLKGEFNKALTLNLEAYEYNSTNAIIADNLGYNYYLLNEHDKALEVYTKLMTANHDMMEPYYNYGLVLMKKGRTKEALDNFYKADIFKLNYLCTLSKEDIQARINEAEKALKQEAQELKALELEAQAQEPQPQEPGALEPQPQEQEPGALELEPQPQEPNTLEPQPQEPNTQEPESAQPYKLEAETGNETQGHNAPHR